LENGVHVLLTVLVGGLEVVQLLLQVRDLSLDIGSFFGLAGFHIVGGGQDEPGGRERERGGQTRVVLHGDAMKRHSSHLANAIVHGRVGG
jgi:hypothetical protein